MVSFEGVLLDMEGKRIKHSYVVHLTEPAFTKTGILLQFTDGSEVCVAYSPSEGMWTDTERYMKFYVSDSPSNRYIMVYALDGDIKFSVDYDDIAKLTGSDPYWMDNEDMRTFVYNHYRDVLFDMELLP